jgi:hypothetical protein
MIFFIKKYSNFIFCNLNRYFFSTNQVTWFLVQGEKNREIWRKKKRSSRLGRHGRVEGFQTSACLRGYLGCLYLARDVWAFCVAIAVWCREPEQGDLWFHHCAHLQVHFVHFTCKTNGKILFYNMFFLLFYYMKTLN